MNEIDLDMTHIKRITNKNPIKRIFIATLPTGYFGKARNSWTTLDPKNISSDLISNGYDVIVTNITNLLKLDLTKDDLVIYTSSDSPVIRGYLTDVMYFVAKKCPIIPHYEALLAHENKGFQQLYRNEKDLGNLNGSYAFDLDSCLPEFPIVYKTINGAGSTGVSLIREESDLKRIRKRDFKTSWKRRVITYIRQLRLTSDEFEIYQEQKKGLNRFVYQDFIPNLSYDYKILIFGPKYFVLKRSVRKNDFRASGSGNFSFEEVPEMILKFAKAIFSKLDVPYVSLDVAASSDNCQLIEYQALNFGPYTLEKSPGYYVEEDRIWNYVPAISDLESNFSEALEFYIKSRYA